MSGTVKPATQAIRTATTILDEAVGQVARSIGACWRNTGTYESDVECVNILLLIVRHVESINELALRDLVTYPSAVTIARSCFEAAIKLLWLSAPDDPYDREVRWLAHLQSEEDFLLRIASHLAKLGHGDSQQGRADTIRNFRCEVTARLPPGYQPLKQAPNLFQMLQSLGEERKYLVYIAGCQYSHSSHYATGIYRKHLGTHKVLGETVEERDWHLCFSMGWYSLWAASQSLYSRIGFNSEDFLPNELCSRTQSAINALAAKQ